MEQAAKGSAHMLSLYVVRTGYNNEGPKRLWAKSVVVLVRFKPSKKQVVGPHSNYIVFFFNKKNAKNKAF